MFVESYVIPIFEAIPCGACQVNELMLTMLFRQYPGFQEVTMRREMPTKYLDKWLH